MNDHEKNCPLLFCFIYSLFILFLRIEKLTSKAVNGATQGLTSNENSLDSLIANLSRTLAMNIRQELIGDSAQEDIKIALAELIVLIKDSTNSFLTELQRDQIDVLLLKVNNSLNSIRNNLLGKATEETITALINSVIKSVVEQLYLSRDKLLGTSTQLKLDTLFNMAFVSLDANFKNHITPNIDSILIKARNTANATGEKARFFSNKIVWIIVSGIIVAGLGITLLRIWILKAKKDQLLKLYAQQINEIPDQKVYDQIVKKITEQSKGQRLDKFIDEVRETTRIKDQKRWKEKDYQLLRLIANQLNKYGRQTNFLSLVEREAQAVGLKNHLQSKLFEVS